jgi:hypothetical protein
MLDPKLEAFAALQNLLALEEGGEIQSEYLVDPTAPSAGRVRVTTSAGWGETHVTLTYPQPISLYTTHPSPASRM